MTKHTTFFRFIGGILLVSGTTIGAGMLALPVSTAFLGFFPSIIIFFICWLFMLFTGFFFLDVNFSIRGEINLISMAGRTLGLFGKVVSWIVYILLLYSLVAAYIAGSAPLFKMAIKAVTGIEISQSLSYFCLPILFGWFVYLGTLGVDWINKFLMLGLIISYVILVIFLPRHVEIKNLAHEDFRLSLIPLSVIITSFGYHIIIPSLTNYMNHDKKHLKWTIIIGSVIPLIVYIIWQVLVLGVVPLHGENGLIRAWAEGVSSTEPLSKIIASPWLAEGAMLFSFFAIVTSFLGVSLSLSDFLIDGLKLKKGWEGRLMACLLTFIPPLLFVIKHQRGFILALEYAGIFVAILLIILPVLMAWHLETPKFYKTMKGKILMALIVLFGFLIIFSNLAEKMNVFKPLTDEYLLSEPK